MPASCRLAKEQAAHCVIDPYEVAVDSWTFPEEIVKKATLCGATLPDLADYEQVPVEEAQQRLGVSVPEQQILLCPRGFSGDLGIVVTVRNGVDNVFVFGARAAAKRSAINIRGSGNVFCMGDDALLRGAVISLSEGGYCVFGRAVTTNASNRFVVRGPSGVMVGDDSMFASSTMVRTWDSHGIFDKDSKEPINPPESVDLQSHVWIGDEVTILKGTWLGTHSVIATNSVVTKSVEPYCIAAGVPAKVVRRNVVWSRSRMWQDEPVYEDVARRYVTDEVG